MQKKYKFFVLFFFIQIFLGFSEESKKNIAFILSSKENISLNAINSVKNLIDIAETNLIEKYKNLYIKNINGDIDIYNFKKVMNYAFSIGLNNYYILEIIENDNSIDINIKLYNSIGNSIYEDKFNFIFSKKNEDYISEDKKNDWINIILSSFSAIVTEKKELNTNFKKKSLKFKHDFPYVSLGISAVSGNIYFDDRMFTRAQKIFSFFPVDIRLSLFPLKYFEFGLFINFDVNNMVYKYYNYYKDEYNYFDSNFIFYYGTFLGFSLFNNFTHYSFGIQIYNLYYDLTTYKNWSKTGDINSYLLPQIAIYQKVDFKILKFLYFTIFVNLETLPLFYLKESNFYSKPFLYDFLFLNISILGFTLII